MEQVLESRGIWRAQRSTKHVIEHFVFNAKSEYGGILVSLVTAYVHMFCFLFQTVKSLSSNIEALKKEVMS